MDKEQNKVVVQMVKKLSLPLTKELISHTAEFLRLLQVKSSVSNVSDTARTVICIDLANSLLGTHFTEDSTFIQASGLKSKSAYSNTKRTFEKILDISHNIGINEICVQLGRSEVKNTAIEILNKYKNGVAQKGMADDLSHPQYAAMSVFFACKKCQVKISKQKLIPFSHLKGLQWNYLEKEFEKILEADSFKTKKPAKTSNKENLDEQMDVEDNSKANEKSSTKQTHTNDDQEDYEHWKARILEKAYKDLSILQKTKHP